MDINTQDVAWSDDRPEGKSLADYRGAALSDGCKRTLHPVHPYSPDSYRDSRSLNRNSGWDRVATREGGRSSVGSVTTDQFPGELFSQILPSLW